MNAIETAIALSEPWAVRNGRLTGKAQIVADAVTSIERYARANGAPRKLIAYRLACALSSRYGFHVAWEKGDAQ